MELFQNEPVVTKITAALFVPAGGGTPIHTNRKAHGLAFNTEHTTTYRFFDGTVLTCHSGQCIYLPQGSSYSVDITEASQDPTAGVYAINFLLEKPLADQPVLLTPRAKADVLSAFSHAQGAWKQKRPGHREVCLSQLYMLLSILGREQEDYRQQTGAVAMLTPALQYIRENYTAEEIPVAALAKLCGVSQPYLRRLFHSAFGMPPARYIRHTRLMYARELLLTGEYTVTQAALACGFRDNAYFSREFKKATGQLPSSLGKNQ